MIGWIKNQSAMRAPNQSEWCVVLEAIVLSPKLQWCGWVRTLISSKTSVLCTTSRLPLLFFPMVRLHLSFLSNGEAAPLFPFSMVRLHLSFPSQWCGYPLSSLSMVWLHISLLSHWCGCTFLFSLNSISITLSINLYNSAPLHIRSPFIIFPKHSHSLPYAQHFFFFNVLKTSFPKKPFPSLYLPQKPSSFIYHLFSPFMP